MYPAVAHRVGRVCRIMRLLSMKLSIVTSLYRSEPYVAEFHRRIRAVAAEITSDCEVIYVNDGSPDEALAVALRLKEADDQLVVVDLSRNFGHHRALMVGLSYATGDLVFMIDVDLEEEPELLREFYARFLEAGADSIYGVQSERKGNAFERISGQIFYRFVNFCQAITLPATP
jgi:putative glycosyltransferase